MGEHYKQLNIDERYELYRLKEAGFSQKEISVELNRSASTISRELNRNSLPQGGYKPASAERISLSRCRRTSRIERLSPLGDLVRDRLAMGWSPEQISGRLRLEESDHRISHESIYHFIYRAKASRGRRYFKRRRDARSPFSLAKRDN